MIDSKMPDAPWQPQGWTHRQILRVTRNSLLAHGLSMLVVLLIAWMSSLYHSVFPGPFTATMPN